MTDQLPRRFHLVRDIDETGTSGVGTVVEGLEFTDGTVALRWLTATTSTAIYASIADVETIHGHGGKTRVEWIDDQPEPGGLEPLRDEANEWRHKAIRRALGTAELHGALNGCRDLISEEITRTDGWGDGYREAIGDLREVLVAFGQLEPAHDGPTVAELAANDRNWDVEKEGE